MKKYKIEMDCTVKTVIPIYAETEEEARKILYKEFEKLDAITVDLKSAVIEEGGED